MKLKMSPVELFDYAINEVSASEACEIVAFFGTDADSVLRYYKARMAQAERSATLRLITAIAIYLFGMLIGTFVGTMI